MTLAPLSSPSRRLAAIAVTALLVAACAVPTNEPTPTATPAPTVAPTVPPYTLAPTPANCPTSAPFPLPVGATSTVTMVTNFGTIVIKVDATLGPNAAGAFTALSRCSYYNDVIFHRIVPGFVIQAGDGEYARLPNLTPDKMGSGGPSWTIPDDKVTKIYTRGMVAIARKGVANSGSSQFFIVLDDAAQTSLGAASNNNYAQVGYVTSGMDVVDRIAQIPVGGENGDFPLQAAVILSTTVTVP
jgi:cyclophilin family peptidyl-prolyl cis-trans isomerase